MIDAPQSNIYTLSARLDIALIVRV